MLDFHAWWPWVTLALLGAFHVVNPAMGWLFAVSLGFQNHSARAVGKAIGPIALGHAIAIAGVAIPVGLLQIVLPTGPLLILSGLALMLYAVWKVMTRFRHPRWVGMRVQYRELVSWSALMAAAHGAGMMLVPALAGLSSQRDASAAELAPLAGPHHHHASGESESLPTALAAVSVHTAAMFLVTGCIALAVYRWIGVGILRGAWINLDLIWTATLSIAGGLTLVMGVWSLTAS